MNREVLLSEGLSSAAMRPREEAPGRTVRQRFLDDILALGCTPPDSPPPPHAAFSEAVAWLAGVPRRAVRDVLSRYATSRDEENPHALTPQILEALYERVAWESGASPFATRKAQGSFHTPSALVTAMVDDALRAFLVERGASSEAAIALVPFAPPDARILNDRGLRDAVDALVVVDPSVGPGSFLAGALAALRTLRARLGLHPDPPAGALCGVDVSPLAIDVCRLRLSLSGYADARLHVGDSLVDSETFAWRRTFGDVFERGGFDVVIGNPPYLRDSNRKNLDADALRAAYRAATSHYDLYVLFMERALQIARPGGQVCLLTSNRWLAQKYGRGIRELLLENELRGVLDLRFKSFEGALVHTSVTLVQRRSDDVRPERDTVLARADELSDVRSMFHPDLKRIPQSGLDSGPFRFELEGDDAAIGEQMRQGGVPLREIAFVSLGMVFHDPRPGGKRKAAYLSAEKTKPFDSPLLDGEHVGRWRPIGQLWLDYRPDEHREPRFPEMFAADKVLCRRIIGAHRIMAMVEDERRWFSDNVVGVVPYHAIQSSESRTARTCCTPERVRNSRGYDVHYLAAVVNSRAVNWYYQKLLGFGMHLYPAHLKSMPIPAASKKEQRELSRLARKARDAEGQSRLQIEADIDDRVERLYGLSVAARSQIGNHYDVGPMKD